MTRMSGGGVRLKRKSRRLSVKGLRARFTYLFKRALKRWRCSYGRAFRSLKKGIKRNPSHRNCNCNCNHNCSHNHNHNHNHNHDSSSRRCLMETPSVSFDRRCVIGRSNSFYSEAIADCLEFIKRSSFAVDDQQALCQR